MQSKELVLFYFILCIYFPIEKGAYRSHLMTDVHVYVFNYLWCFMAGVYGYTVHLRTLTGQTFTASGVVKVSVHSDL